MLQLRRLSTAVVGCLALPLLATAAHADPAGTIRAGAANRVEAPHFNPNDFTHPLAIDNRFLPFSPGMRFVLEGTVDGAPHRVVLVVTDLVKVVNGVRTAVLWDRDFDDGQLAEAELAFQAQDDSGAVWNLGEYPELYDENGRFVGAPDTWFAGIDQARAGLHMLARPKEGTPSYVQGFAPTIDFLDVGRVAQTGQHACDGIRCYDNVLVVDETSPLDPASGHQLKYYAPGVGNILIVPDGGNQQESLVLVSRTRLDAAGLAHARAAALALESRAYRVSDVYQQTPPAHRRG
jgi:hypothetical protein